MTLHLKLAATTAAVMLAWAAPARADFKLDRQLALAPGGTFTLDTDVGSVSVTGDTAGGAAVSLSSERDDFEDLFEIRFEEAEGTARVTVKRKARVRWAFWRGWSEGHTRFTVRVPAETTVRVKTAGGSIDVARLQGRVGMHTSGGGLRVDSIVGDVAADTSGGSIRMLDVRGNVAASTSGGNVEISNVSGTVTTSTSGGGIRLDGVSGDVSAETSGGSVEVRQAGGRVEAHTSGGSVAVHFGPGNARGGNLSSSGGGIRAELDPSVPLSIDASASGGRVQADIPVTVRGDMGRDALRGDLNGGGALLRLNTSGGGVRISAATRSASAPER
jgi:DUF4097 and DUF4098 domain-containing protein YvlB